MMRALIRKASIALLSVAALAAVVYFAGLRVNLTASLPLGFYWRTFAPLERGSYVMFCPPVGNAAISLARERHYIGNGNCEGRYEMLLKRIAALPGDQIDVDEDGVRVNGSLIANSSPRAVDRLGRALPVVRLHTTLAGDNLLLMSDYTPSSFDARYFGPIARAAVRAQVKPLWTW
jgi:conjugative transfer signal peptidase TraF